MDVECDMRVVRAGNIVTRLTNNRCASSSRGLHDFNFNCGTSWGLFNVSRPNCAVALTWITRAELGWCPKEDSNLQGREATRT